MKRVFSRAGAATRAAGAAWINDGSRPELDWSERASQSEGLASETDIELWRIELDAVPDEVAARLGEMLSADEMDRADRFRFAVDRRRFVVGRGVLRWLLANHLKIPPAAVEFAYGPAGKPRLVSGGQQLRLHFNVTHSGGWAIVALTRAGEIGIDLELVRDLPDWEGVAELALEPARTARLRTLTGGERREAFFQEWTRQEAIAKAHGCGLGAVPRPELFSISTFSFVPGGVASLAVSPTVRALCCRSWWADAASVLSLVPFSAVSAVVAADSAVSL